MRQLSSSSYILVRSSLVPDLIPVIDFGSRLSLYALIVSLAYRGISDTIRYLSRYTKYYYWSVSVVTLSARTIFRINGSSYERFLAIYQFAKVSIKLSLSYASISKISISNPVSGNQESSCPPFSFYLSEKSYPVIPAFGQAISSCSRYWIELYQVTSVLRYQRQQSLQMSQRLQTNGIIAPSSGFSSYTSSVY